MAELSYPLGAGARGEVRSANGTPVSEITADAVTAGRLAASDLTISADTLRLQAGFAARGGNPQLGANLERAAELVDFDEAALLECYELLRPGRASAAELDALAERLASRGADTCAQLVREARAAYVRRGLTSDSEENEP